MIDIRVCAHAPDRATFEACMFKYGLGRMVDGAFEPHPELRISDQFAVTRPTGGTIEIDGIEIPETEIVPGYHANLWAVGNLAQALIRHPGTGEIYPQTDEHGAPLPVTSRTRMHDVAVDGDFVVGGADDNPKLPAGFEADGVRFFDPSDLATPANVWA